MQGPTILIVEHGIGTDDDIAHMESEGCLSGADSSTVSERARVRGADQLGTLGSGNHFLEVQRVAKIIDPQAAEGFGLRQDQVTVLIHSGSRGFGHQVCSEYVRTMNGVRARYRITLPDRQLACAPLSSAEGRRYMRAIGCAANLCLRQPGGAGPSHARVGGADPRARGGRENAPGLRRGPQRRQARDPPRAGTVRAPQGRDEGFPRGIGRDPASYLGVGHPVFIPGSMGTIGFVLVGARARWNARSAPPVTGREGG